MSTTLGKALTETINGLGIGGHIFGIEGDVNEITICRSMQDSNGQIAIMRDEDGFAEPVMVYETFDVHAPR